LLVDADPTLCPKQGLQIAFTIALCQHMLLAAAAFVTTACATIAIAIVLQLSQPWTVVLLLMMYPMH